MMIIKYCILFTFTITAENKNIMTVVLILCISNFF
jgi:hypothetical protein